MRRLVFITLAVLAFTASALAAPAGKYRGRVVDDSGKVRFRVEGNKVKNFKIDGVYASCFSGNQLMTVYVPSARIRDNRFRRTYRPDPDIDFKVTLRGQFNGGRASGRVIGEGVCEYEERWRARKVAS